MATIGRNGQILAEDKFSLIWKMPAFQNSSSASASSCCGFWRKEDKDQSAFPNVAFIRRLSLTVVLRVILGNRNLLTSGEKGSDGGISQGNTQGSFLARNRE